MRRPRTLSPHARSLLSALLDASGRWSHGYDLAKAAGIRSGTLYPLLIRLAEQDYLHAEWQPPAVPGRPARHAYRLTEAGLQLARKVRGEATAPAQLAPRKAGS